MAFEGREGVEGCVLVTGAAGFLGIPVVRALRARGYRVVAVDNGSAGTLGRLEEFRCDKHVMCRVLDIQDGDSLRALVEFEKAWGIVHLAARHFIPDCEQHPVETLNINVVGTQQLLEACAAGRPHRFVFASTGDVYGPARVACAEDAPVGPIGVYGCSKLLGEWLLREEAWRMPDCRMVVARLFNAYGPGDGNPHLIPEILAQARDGDHLTLGDLDATRDFVFVDDAAEALMMLLIDAPAGVYNVGTGHSITGRELVGLIQALTGRAFTFSVDPSRLRRHPRRFLCADASKLRLLAPWWPRTHLVTGLK